MASTPDAVKTVMALVLAVMPAATGTSPERTARSDQFPQPARPQIPQVDIKGGC